MANAIICERDAVLNEDGLRSEREFVQHKLLDAVGDLYLTGLHMIGRYRGKSAMRCKCIAECAV